MSDQRVLVTGGTGFIGRQVLPLLVDAGYEVHVAALPGPVPDGATLHEIDLLNPEARQDVVKRIAAPMLVHLAWFVKPGQVWDSTENVRWLEASVGVLNDFAAAGGERAVFAGTCSEYGPSGGVLAEDAETAPTTLYGACKHALGSVAVASADALGLSVAWPRIFLAYGPGEHPKRLVSSVARNLLLGNPAPCSHGRQVRDYLSTIDIAAALTAILTSDVAGPVNVGSGKGVELREIVSRVADEIGRPDLVEFGALTPPVEEQPVLVADTRRLNEEVGWVQSLSLEAGLRDTVAWWREELRVDPD